MDFLVSPVPFIRNKYRITISIDVEIYSYAVDLFIKLKSNLL